MMQPSPETPNLTPGDHASRRRDAALAAAAATAACIVAANQEEAAEFVTVDLSASGGGRSSTVMHALFDVREQAPVLLLMVKGARVA